MILLHCILRGFRWKLFQKEDYPLCFQYMESAQDQTAGGHWAKGTKKDSKHKMSTNRGISPSLSITLWSLMKKMRRGAFKACASWQEEQQWIKEEEKKDRSRKRKIGLSTKKDGGKKEGRVLEEAPPTEPISSCHKSFLLGKWGEAKCQNIWINSTEACWEWGGAVRGVLLVPMGWRGDERVGEYKGGWVRRGGQQQRGFACEIAFTDLRRNTS